MRTYITITKFRLVIILYTYYKTKNNLFLKTVKICVFLFIESKIEEGKISKIFGVVLFYFKKVKNPKPIKKQISEHQHVCYFVRYRPLKQTR